MIGKRVSPAALHALGEALAKSYWYKQDLRRFLHASLLDRHLVAGLDWSATKRQVASQLVDTLAADQGKHLDTLLNLIMSLIEITDPKHLKQLDDGDFRYAEAVEALNTLRSHAEPYRKLRTEQDEAARRFEAQRVRDERRRGMADQLTRLRELFLQFAVETPQTRGFRFEGFLNGLFALFDIDARGSFRIEGEQIDGAFSLDGTEFILEAKWQSQPTPLADLDVFAQKVTRKLDNTLGLFVSINGFNVSATELHGRGQRPSIILMSGEDLMAVLEDRIALPHLIMRKRQHAARTGHILLPASQLL